MGNSLLLRAPTHYLRVDLDDPAEAKYWLLVLDATRPQIECALAIVGRDAREVRGYLQMHGRRSGLGDSRRADA